MSVTIEEKKHFIKWFLSEMKMKQREITWLFEYMYNRDDLLKHVHFIHEAHLCPKSILVSIQEDERRPFRFYKSHVVTSEVDKAFHDIRLNQDEEIYIEVLYPGVRHSLAYLKVLEENPFLPDDYYMEKDDYLEMDTLIDQLTYEQKVEEYKLKIDEALDESDVASFNLYAEKLNQLTKSRE
ncbi:ReoY family proteolytic degradation factor [Halalkalibacillus halophilus]|uniref:ReoY family proteolytic degradation factor n=1 Tax=Halalkalibacillus halophilus TaxID=392827 RepID=UPI00041DDF79|nr:ReoY family proteolytic degradation factor [Halalkalibacillus halophilus]